MAGFVEDEARNENCFSHWWEDPEGEACEDCARVRASAPLCARALEVLAAVERGEVTLTADVPAKEVYAGNVDYHASNGWQFVLFNDCDSWDYLDSVRSPEGDFVDYEFMTRHLKIYSPPNDVEVNVYGVGMLWQDSLAELLRDAGKAAWAGLKAAAKGRTP